MALFSGILKRSAAFISGVKRLFGGKIWAAVPPFFTDEEEIRAVPQRRRDAAPRAGGENNVVLVQASRAEVKKDIRRPRRCDSFFPGYGKLRLPVPQRLDDCQASQEFVEILALNATGNDKRDFGVVLLREVPGQ